MAAAYVRWSGHHVAERIRPVPGTGDEQRLAVLADDPSSDWTREAVPEPEQPAGRPAQAADKAAWVAWAVTQGADQTDAEAATKAALFEAYGRSGS